MSLISKLQISGIRSFSPLHDETIEFYSPFTMIVGANGCGKTTIIESLKFACTGSLPPNTKSGQSLVNDPGMTDSTEVKAHIKMLFRNRAGHKCVASRILQVTRKRTKLEYKALDSVLKTEDRDTHERASISVKCTEMDRIIPENLGVSSAILENVIFVHQEDSNWPMQESNVLKKKFDDIFESTRYTKALEELLKSKKEFVGKAKDYKAELNELNALLLNANKIRKNLQDYEEEIVRCQEMMDSSDEKLRVNEDRLKAATTIIQKAREHSESLNKLQWKVGELERRIADKSRQIEHPLDGVSDEDLKHNLENFEHTMHIKQREKQQCNQQLQQIQQQINQQRQRSDAINAKKGQATLLQDEARQLKEQQLQTARKLFGNYPSLAVLQPQMNSWSTQLMKDTLQELNKELNKIRRECEVVVQQSLHALQDATQQYNTHQQQLQKVEVELNVKTGEKQDLQQEVDEKRRELTRVTASKSAIQRAQQDYENMNSQLDEFMSSYNQKVNDFKRQIKETNDEIRSLSDQIANDAQLLQELSLHRNEIAALEGSVRQLEMDQQQVNTDLQSIFTTYPRELQELNPLGNKVIQLPDDFHHLETLFERFTAKVSTISQDIKSRRETYTRVQTELAANEARIQQQEQQLGVQQRHLEQLRGYDADIHRDLIPKLQALQDSPVLVKSGFEAVPVNLSCSDLPMLVEIAKKLEDETRDLLMIAKSGKVFLRRLKKMQGNNPNQCPCCSQSIAEVNIRSIYEQRIKQIVSFGDEDPNNSNNNSIEEHKQLLNRCQDVYKEITALQSLVLPILPAKQEKEKLDIQIIQLRQEQQDFQRQVAQEQRTLSELEATLKTMQSIHRHLQENLLKAQSLTQRREDIQERKRRQSQQLFQQNNNLTIDELEQLQRDRQEQKDHLVARKEKLNQDEAQLTKRSFALKQMVADREKALADARLEGKKAEEIDGLLQRLTAKIAENEQRRTDLQHERERCQRLVNESKVQLSARETAHRQQQDLERQRTAAIQTDIDQLQKMNKTLEENERKYRDLNIDDINFSLQTIQQDIQFKEQEIANLNNKIININKDVSSQENTRKNIENNLDLRAAQNELRETQRQLQLLSDQSGASSQQLRQANQELSGLQGERQALTSERDQLRGMVEIHHQNIRKAQDDLKSAHYKNIDERCRKKNIEFETTNLAVADLENYYSALDRALQNFHTLKIREINKIIRELWQLIYQGQDIDTIEIESGAELTADGVAVVNAGSTGSRSYNYRVVMKKGDVPLDMRGRCSAGQKVLACIVIRLALAETFCLNCGILALDEPTTNLDEANKGGLAHALARLIVGRSKQQNFQLICITHDEEFVQLMKNELSMSHDYNVPEYYFRVFRQEDGNTGRFFSHIERIPWEEM